jgi:DNA polymerase-3 subunit gamma/tau
MSEQEAGGASARYTVVARRYRPKSFDELVGQETVARALRNAIESGRVGHAYLFTGARGVGKTSTARIFAKALNAPEGPSMSPPQDTDAAQAIDSGEDIDVIEIDGASNRGIDEIRQLRANVNVRPSRSRYKIYIIDEVHMLTTQAFNALLKTLEEPPAHVKFFFCTTDPEKIPITVLSRCQRFDFAPVKTDAILDRLKFICREEKVEADDEALALIARKANGSMRDSQSLLEQILSFSQGRIDVQQVHDLLGTADDSMLQALAEGLARRAGGEVLEGVERAIGQGVDAGQLGEQMLGYLRDLLAAGVGAPASLFRTAHPGSYAEVKQLAQTWGPVTLLSAIQILDEALVKMRSSVQGRTILEVALLQICHLQDLQRVVEWVNAAGRLPEGASEDRSSTEKKKSLAALMETQAAAAEPPVVASDPLAHRGNEPAIRSESPPTRSDGNRSSASERGEPVELPDAASENYRGAESLSSLAPAEPTVSNVSRSTGPLDLREILQEVAKGTGAFVADFARAALRLERLGERTLRLIFPKEAALAVEHCSQPDNRAALRQIFEDHLKESVDLELIHSEETAPKVVEPTMPDPSVSRLETERRVQEHPLVRRVLEQFRGEIVRIEPAAKTPPGP